MCFCMHLRDLPLQTRPQASDRHRVQTKIKVHKHTGMSRKCAASVGLAPNKGLDLFKKKLQSETMMCITVTHGNQQEIKGITVLEGF